MNNLFFKTKKLVCLFAIMTYGTIVFSQTTTINYLTSGLSTTACNVFNPNVAVNNVTHSSLAGGVSFNAYESVFTFNDDGTLSYTSNLFMKLAATGQQMHHTDRNTLHRVKRYHPSIENI